MSDSLTSSTYSSKEGKRKCPKSPNGKHKYITTCGSWPSEERTCIYCKDSYYTK